MSTSLAQRLHHTAFVTKDQEATRAFYQDVLGFPLLATWSEADELFGAVRVYCHTFFGLADGSALAFFQFADEADQELFDPALAPSPFRHIAMKVDADGQAEIERRLTDAKWKPEQTYVLEHGYCRSLYTEDPNGTPLEFTLDVPRPPTSPSCGRRTPTRRCAGGSPAITPATTRTADVPDAVAAHADDRQRADPRRDEACARRPAAPRRARDVLRRRSQRRRAGRSAPRRTGGRGRARRRIAHVEPHRALRPRR